jgi:hypothetical protein
MIRRMTLRRHSRREPIRKREDLFRGSAAAFGFEALFQGGYYRGSESFARQSGEFRGEQNSSL